MARVVTELGGKWRAQCSSIAMKEENGRPNPTMTVW